MVGVVGNLTLQPMACTNHKFPGNGGRKGWYICLHRELDFRWAGLQMVSRALKWRSEHEGKRKEGKKGKEEREKS